MSTALSVVGPTAPYNAHGQAEFEGVKGATICEAVRLIVEEGIEGEVAATRPGYYSILHVARFLRDRLPMGLAPKLLNLM